jgi:hypothetical protein
MSDQIGRARVSLRLSCRTLLVAAVAYACGGGSDAPTQTQSGGRGVRVVAGGGQTDTILAPLRQALVVEIRDSTGAVARGASVTFSPVVDRNGAPGVLVSPPDRKEFSIGAGAVADARGQVTLLVKLGTVAGTARLEVTAPALGAIDTVTFTVKPGAPAKFSISPRDTSVAPGTGYALRAAVADQFSNPIAGPVPTFTASGVSVTSTGQITAPSSMGRGRILLSYQRLSDSAFVSVVPRLPMVINRSSGAGGAVVLINSDGSGSSTLAANTDNSLSPSSVAATRSVVFYRGDPGSNGRVWVVQPNENPRLLVPGETRAEAWPRLSSDGAWVYFVRGSRSLWRVRLDGTGLDSLTDFVPPRVYSAPTISPDGRSVAIEDASGLKVVDVAARVSSTLPVACAFPAYSPDGAFFSCETPSDISVVKTDGTGQRVVVSFAVFGSPDELSGLDWTPDGKWILSMLRGKLTLVELSSGAVLPLTGLGPDALQGSFVK